MSESKDREETQEFFSQILDALAESPPTPEPDKHKPAGYRFETLTDDEERATKTFIPVWNPADVDDEATALAPVGYGVRMITIADTQARQAFETWNPAEIDAAATAEIYEAQRRQRFVIRQTSKGASYTIFNGAPLAGALGPRSAWEKNQKRFYQSEFKQAGAAFLADEISADKWLHRAEDILQDACYNFAMRVQVERCFAPDDPRADTPAIHEHAKRIYQGKRHDLAHMAARLKSKELEANSRNYQSEVARLISFE
jgi:hypothetical protein